MTPIEGDSDRQCASEGFKNCLNNMMEIIPSLDDKMNRHPSINRKGPKKFGKQLCIKITAGTSRLGPIQANKGPTRNINVHRRPRLIHGESAGAIAADTPAFAERMFKGLPKADRRILNGMVKIDIGITNNRALERKPTVKRKEFEHVSEKTAGDGNRNWIGLIKIKRKANLCFFGISLKAVGSHQFLSFRFFRTSMLPSWAVNPSARAIQAAASTNLLYNFFVGAISEDRF
jgi:hypothetical protein